jgi:LPPG:FO 2-phospho-L-lactate transferase
LSCTSVEFGGKVLALCGGVGGAKLALGLTGVLPAEQLLVVTNTGDDFTHVGLQICPDIDTVTYTLSGLANTETGWGRQGETWQFMESMKMLGGEDWFSLGDKDLATHIERTRRLAAGESLSAITASNATTLGIGPTIAPMTDDSVPTIVETVDGDMAFQHYFVRDRCEPVVTGIRFAGAADASPSPAFAQALQDDNISAIIICPSNPFLSVDPILALPGVASALRKHPAPVVAVSPIVGGIAIKGPTAKMMAELKMDVSALGVAGHYGDLLDGFIIDETDRASANDVAATGVAIEIAQTIMKTNGDRTDLAQVALSFCEKLASAR